MSTFDHQRVDRGAARLVHLQRGRRVKEGVLAVLRTVGGQFLQVADLGQRHAEVAHQGAVQRKRYAVVRVGRHLVGDGVGDEVRDLHVLEPLHEFGTVDQARFAEALVELLALVEEKLEEVRPDDQDVALFDPDALSFSARRQILVGEGLGFAEVLLAAEAGHVEQDAPPDDTALRDRGHTGFVQSADRGTRVVPIPELAAVPDVAERVVLRRTLEKRADLVVCIVQATRELRSAVAVPRGFVQDHRLLGRRPPGPNRVALGVADQPLQREHGAGLDVAHPAEDFLGGEVIQRANLILLPPFAPVLRGILEYFTHGRDVSHPGRSFLAERTERSLGDP